MSNIGQIFYGRAPDGYGVLGSSPAGRPFIGAVAAICRAVGSPDRPGDVRSFLLSKREGAVVLMIRACRGAADPTGRATIFFHALIADAAALRAVGLDAFALANAGVFAESCPSREPPDLPFPNAKQHQVAPAEGRGIDLPATIASERPLDELVRQELGAKSLDLNWATFTFNPLPDFDLCVLSSYSPRKGTGTLYVFDDAGLHRLSPVSATRKTVGKENSSIGRPPMQKSSCVLLLSLVANAILVLTIFFRGSGADGIKLGGKPTVTEISESDAREKWESKWKSEWEKSLPPTPSDMTEAEAKAKWAAQWKAEWEKSLPTMPSAMTEAEAKAKWETQRKKEWETAYHQKLRSSFEKRLSGNHRISDFEKAMLKIDPYYEDYKANKAKPPTPQAMDLYKTLKLYVSFVEDTIITPKKQNKER